MSESASKRMELDPNFKSGDYYTDSYSAVGIHEEMIKDSVRTQTYQRAIQRNAHLFKDKVVLDVGCGTGILSLFAAQAGARLVIGVDMSEMAHTAKRIVQANKMDHVVKILQGKMEEVDLAQFGVNKGEVDIIISEWMGYCLLYESMLDSVLDARDTWLRPKTGLIFPDKAKMYIAAIEDADYKDEKIKFWDSVYGFDFSCVKDNAIRQPLVDMVDGKQVVTRSQCILDVDINTVTKPELDFACDFRLKAERDDFCQAFTMFFDVSFPGHKPITFSTGPYDHYTHWKQTTVYLREDLIMLQDEVVSGRVEIKRNPVNFRALDITLSYKFQGEKQTVARQNDVYYLQ